ncbi:serine/threonine-protein kinase [Luteimonas sp. MC1572]|uniref:serine/threonine-protein kinase n=1 Tax=Luteimonas sp. MC1572 TaxID=2799325 RepID=UPI0018F0DE10|nr:serine/threonine-protein kinase [Luteimonas sp. MC1572]MBJ6982320.1 serine/threonine protein kinase [Luteimonas sp. MC1572]QQO03589.1 serine/threonine protein kinase [Luteimonas sp. MC1572]
MPIDPRDLDDWRAADTLFDQWLDLPEGERAAWLAAQRPDPAVAHRLEQLTNAHVRPRASLDPLRGDLAGCRLGSWTLESELGRGGMAVVYRASRDDGMARQHAAIKILTLAALGATGRERFQREAAILARLNHPNITPLTDSGSAADGTCWLAMPLVEGERIDRWCEAHSPDARATVRLYLQVCDAVAYAHRNLVIHRDLKPSNVLVEAGGHVRLLDFGIGQFTDSTDEATQTMWRAMTPGYAAPEQMDGAPPSTAIDVYGLGALLHRLLTGRTPQAATGAGTTTRPSQLVRDSRDACHRHYVPLKNDLDRVLLKALAEQPGARYPSAESFADDLRRWLDGMPVLAQAPGLGYRVRKFVARNALGVAAGVLLAASLAGGIGATLWQASVARNEAANARVQAQRAILVRDFLQRVFASTEPANGRVPDALELLGEGAQRARSEVLADDPLAAADILMLTGRARLELDHVDEARTDLEQARDLFAVHAPDAHAERARVESDLSRLMRDRGEVDAALAHARAGVAFAELALAGANDPRPLLEAKTTLAMGLFSSDPHAAKVMFEEVLEALLQHGLQDTELHLTALGGLGTAMNATDPDDTARIVALAEEEIRLSRLLDGTDSGWHASALANQVPSFSRAGDHARAEQIAFEAAAIADRIYTRPHSTRSSVHCQLAAFLQWRGRHAEALEHYAIANEINTALERSDLHVEACFRYSGYVRAALGDHGAALVDLERSWQILGQHDYRASATGYGSCGVRASVQLRLGDLGGAARTLAGCPMADGEPPQMMHTQAHAELHLVRGELAEAAKLAAEMRGTRPPETGDRYWMRPWMLSLLLAHRQGQHEVLATLESGLAAHAAAEPLARCLARPSEAHCLALP